MTGISTHRTGETALLRWVSELSGCRAVGLDSIKVYLLGLLRADVYSSQNALENQHLVKSLKYQ